MWGNIECSGNGGIILVNAVFQSIKSVSATLFCYILIASLSIGPTWKLSFGQREKTRPKDSFLIGPRCDKFAVKCIKYSLCSIGT